MIDYPKVPVQPTPALTRDGIMAKYPILFSESKLPMTQTCMCWGIECGAGWLLIVDALAAKLEAMNVLHPDDPITFTQVKEKFGTLRIYFNAGSDYTMTEKLIDEAEAASAKTCEDCGAPGKCRPGGWIRTLCDKCNKKP